jgi:tRNA threonylcarbamoyladenosine biosynthesis protein TsaB
VILGIETATTICSVGIASGEKIIAELRFDIKNIHAEVLSESINQLLRLSGTDLKNIEAFAVSIGPGSFTGLRIGLATAKGLAFASGKPLVVVSTLQAQAAIQQCSVNIGQLESPFGWSVIPVIKARAGEIYTARFQNAWPAPILQSDEVLLAVQDFPKWLQPPAVLCGNGIAMLQKHEVLTDSSDIVIVPDAAAMLSGGVIARLGATRLARGETADLPNLEPRYLQEFEIGPRKG